MGYWDPSSRALYLQGAWWLSSRVLDLRLRGHWFKTQQRHCVVALSKRLYPQLSTGSTEEVSKVAKIRNRYNQVPHLTQDTNGKVTNSQKTPQTRAKRSALSQQVTTKHI